MTKKVRLRSDPDHPEEPEGKRSKMMNTVRNLLIMRRNVELT